MMNFAVELGGLLVLLMFIALFIVPTRCLNSSNDYVAAGVISLLKR